MTMARIRIEASVRRETEERLRRVARAATVLVDGEAFKGIPLRPELNTGDDYAVDHEKFITVKKTLLKLKRLEEGDIGITSWRPWPGEQMEQVCPVDTHPLTVRPGNHPLSPAVAAAFRGEIATQELEWRGYPLLSVCAPIRDSLEDVVGAVEVFASLVPDRFRVNALDY
ncbi:MAG: hypothetical protein ACUVWX_08765 [Kiritimatiellia bacterium]